MNSFNLIFATVIEKGHDYIQTDETGSITSYLPFPNWTSCMSGYPNTI
jgi:hypothetical protein